MSTLINSNRSVLKATYAPVPGPAQPVGAHESVYSHAQHKATLVRDIQLQKGDVDTVQARMSAAGSALPGETLSVLRQFEPQPLAILLPKPTVLANIPQGQLTTFAQSLVSHRTDTLRAFDAAPAQAPLPSPALPPTDPADHRAAAATRASKKLLATAVPRAAVALPSAAGVEAGALAAPDRALVAGLVTAAHSGLSKFVQAVSLAPIGMLHLERIEMAPAGVERGELIATIPLAPNESTSVVQKEWAVTSDEFSSIVTDSLDNYSEKGVTEKSELADSTESQTKHSQQLGLNASLSGSYGFVTFTTNASFNSTSSDDETKKASRSHASEVTSKASSRVRKEHKVTIQTASTAGKEDTSTRILSNPSATDPMRIDYFSMMRKWQVRLFQYGVRMTYDLVIPEPGATLRELHAELADLERKLDGGFDFELSQDDIEPYDQSKPSFYLKLAKLYGAVVPPPQSETKAGPSFTTPIQAHPKGAGWYPGHIEFDVDGGYEIGSVSISAVLQVDNSDSASTEGFLYLSNIGYLVQGGVWNNNVFMPYLALGGSAVPMPDNSFNASFVVTTLLDAQTSRFPIGYGGHQQISWLFNRFNGGEVDFAFTYVPTKDALALWKVQAWQALHDAARDAYYTTLQANTQRRDAIKATLEGVDTLTLRREEREEIMKGVLRWLLGPDFDFMPPEVVGLFDAATGTSLNGPPSSQETHGEAFTGSHLTGISKASDSWPLMVAYGEMVKFIMEAVEWENLLYVIYPYFWDVPAAWDFVRALEHPDPTREAFLRGGSARVVLTIRPGWESSFLAFVDSGDFQALLPTGHPYLTIAQEIQAFANTNYPDIPPANPEVSFRSLLTPIQRRAWQSVQALMALLEIYKANQGSYPTTQQGVGILSQVVFVPASDPWGRLYTYDSQDPSSSYALASLGADGLQGGTGDDSDLTLVAPPSSPSSAQQKALLDLKNIAALLEVYKTANGAYPTKVQGLGALSTLAALLRADPWGNPYYYKSLGDYADYDLASLGADGALGGDGANTDISSWAAASLIGEWFEYTPSHGTDIAVTSHLEDVS